MTAKIQTQPMAASAGQITPAMRHVAECEGVDAELVCEKVGLGQIVIPANPAHESLKPVGIGRALRVKVNANIGNSALASSPCTEAAKLRAAIECGADAVMDLSTGEAIDEIRARLLAECPVPFGTVPIYQALTQVERPLDLTTDLLFEVIEGQARQGVDFMTVHAGLLRAHVPLATKRLAGIVSRGGAILAQWMNHHRRENPLYEEFDRLLEICVRHDVTLSLGDGLRPGCLADASDNAQFAELAVLGELVGRCRKAGVQAMVEGPGHIPLDQVEMNMLREREVCDDAPFYILGPVVCDCAPGYDHIAGAIGGALGAWHGAAMLCYVTPKEHLGLPNVEDVRRGVIAFKLAAHAADIARGMPGARDRDDAITRARVAFDWERQFDLALDPARARAYREESKREAAAGRPTTDATADEAYCTMCGPGFCSMRISRQLLSEEATL